MTSRAERVMWTVIGLLLVVVGGAGIAASFGHLPGTHATTPLLWSGLLDLWRSLSPWNFVVTIALGLLIALLGLNLLTRIVRPPRPTGLDEVILSDSNVEQAPAADMDETDVAPVSSTPNLPGRTRVRGSVLARGLERDLERDPQVHRVSVELTGGAARPALRINLHIAPRARITAVRDAVGAAVERFCRTSGLRPAHLDITAQIDAAGRGRVR